jgi:hypothetical protein
MNRIRSLGLTLLCAIAGIAAAQAPTQRIRGDVIALDGATLQMKSESGQTVAVKLANDVRISGRSRANLDDIKTGVFLGTTAVPQPNGTLVATEVHVFPESMRGTGEGHRPFDGPPGSTMTNATVTNMTGAAARSTKPQSTMTNATVATVADADHTRRMTLKYKDGEKVIVVPDDVPVVMVEPGDRSLLVPGAHIIVVATKAADGTMSADRVSVGKNGLIPPI